MKHLILAFQFLTIIPIKRRGVLQYAPTDIVKSSSFFVIVGLVQGLLLVTTDYISGMFFYPDLVIGILLFILVLSNGGFHLDGLADTFDALAMKSCGNDDEDKKMRLAVMKDSSTGPIGVTAIVFALILKYLSLKNISHFSFFTYYSSLFLMPALSKWTMVLAMFYGNPAKKDGLGSIFISKIGFKEVGFSTLNLFLLLALPLIFFSHSIPNHEYIFYAVLLCTMYILCRMIVKFFDKKFGGLTGDTLGAISEITEIIFLLMVIIWSRIYI